MTSRVMMQSIERTVRDLEQVLDGRTPERLDDCICWLQVALAFIQPSRLDDRPGQRKQIRNRLRDALNAGRKELSAPMRSSHPFAFMVAYPHSGNSHVTADVARVLNGHIFGLKNDKDIPFSKAAYPEAYPFIRLIKDRSARRIYAEDKTVIIVRDGREVMSSLAMETRGQGDVVKPDKSEMAEWIRWTSEDFQYGPWSQHLRTVANLVKNPCKMVIKYEDYLEDPEQLIDIVRFIDPDFPYDASFIGKFRETGGGSDGRAGSKMTGDAGSNWRNTWNLEARKAFHETGATEFLLRHGYETGSDWWKG